MVSYEYDCYCYCYCYDDGDDSYNVEMRTVMMTGDDSIGGSKWY